MLDRIHERGLDANVSVKLTAMGLDISEELCVTIIHDILAQARDYRTFVRLDMESSAYADRTLRLFYERFYPTYPEHVGIVLQSYLRRTAADVERAVQARCRVRLCKGAYQESPSVAFPDKRDVDANYARCMHRLLRHGHYPGLATHDERLIEDAKRFARARRRSIPRASSSRCCTACGGTCRTRWSATGTGSACTCRSARSGIRI